MFAVIVSGGKQYRVHTGETLKLEMLPGVVGDPVTFDKVLMVSHEGETWLGQPYLTDRAVLGVVLNHSRRKKIKIIKLKRRKHHLKRQGHRQYYTTVQITEIVNATA